MREVIDQLSILYPKSLIAEFRHMFGAENTEKLLAVFGGMTLAIPSHDDVLRVKRDIHIYTELLKAGKDKAKYKAIRKSIQAKYGMSKSKVRSIFQAMHKLHKKDEKIVKTDQAIGKLKRRKLKAKKHRRDW